MSKLDELLQGVDVEWKKLWEVTTWDKKFNSVEKHKQPKTNKYKYLLASEIKPLILEKGTIKLLSTNDTNWWTSEELVGNNFHEGEIIAIPWGGNPIVQYYKGKFLTGDNRIAVVNDPEYLSTKFLHYYLTNNINLISSFYRGAGIKHPNMHNVLELDIPIPPIEIQQEIVRVLDELTSLTNQLTTELEAERQNRKKQFEFFREQLFRFEDSEIQIKPLIEVAEIGTGSRNTNEAVIDGEYPFFVRSQIPRAINEFEFDETAIITAGDGVGVGKVFHYISGKYALHQRAYRIVLKSNILCSKYLFYYIKNNFSKYIEKISVHASVTSLRKPMFEKYPIPIPPLEEQERIVKFLDQFDATHTAIEEEITKEIKLRTQQYEYYREKLLSFPQN